MTHLMYIIKINNTTKVNKNVFASQDALRSQMEKNWWLN